jgi:uncharacterized protein YgfB (UPF0149 family)
MPSIEDRMEALEARLEEIDEHIGQVAAVLLCGRCRSPEPDLPRWHGDPQARDHRPPHVCGKSRWSR